MSKLHFRSVAWSLFTMKMQTVLQSSSWIVFPDWTLILLISLPWLIDLTYLSQISWSSKYILMFLTSNEDTHFFNALWLKETRHSCSNDLTDLQCASWDFWDAFRPSSAVKGTVCIWASCGKMECNNFQNTADWNTGNYM